VSFTKGKFEPGKCWYTTNVATMQILKSRIIYSRPSERNKGYHIGTLFVVRILVGKYFYIFFLFFFRYNLYGLGEELLGDRELLVIRWIST